MPTLPGFSESGILGDVEPYCTRHARNRMRLYEITVEEVGATLVTPEQVTAGAFGRQHAWKQWAQGKW